jgi:hypothetical protein
MKIFTETLGKMGFGIMVFQKRLIALGKRVTHRPYNGGRKHIWKVDKHLPGYTVRHQRRQSSSFYLFFFLLVEDIPLLANFNAFACNLRTSGLDSLLSHA